MYGSLGKRALQDLCLGSFSLLWDRQVLWTMVVSPHCDRSLAGLGTGVCLFSAGLTWPCLPEVLSVLSKPRTGTGLAAVSAANRSCSVTLVQPHFSSTFPPVFLDLLLNMTYEERSSTDITWDLISISLLENFKYKGKEGFGSILGKLN